MDRAIRVAEEIKREIGAIIQNELKDPRLPDFVSVTTVRVSRDLKYAKVYVSVMGEEKQKEGAIDALKSAAGFIRHEIGKRIRIRYTPEISFILDDSIDRGMHIVELINETQKKGNK